MLYTVRPLERVYAEPGVFDIKKESKAKGSQDTDEQEYREIMLPNGRITTRRKGEDYIIEGINSTDMSDYLNEEYVPGKSYKDKKSK